MKYSKDDYTGLGMFQGRVLVIDHIPATHVIVYSPRHLLTRIEDGGVHTASLASYAISTGLDALRCPTPAI